MNKRKKLLTLMATIFLLFPSIFGMGEVIYHVYADANKTTPEEVDIKIHKVKAAVDNPDLSVQNTGDEMSQFANNDRINNIEFTLFDVTKYYEQVLLNGMFTVPPTDEDERIKAILGATLEQKQAAYHSTSSYFLLKSSADIRKEGFESKHTSRTKKRENFSGKLEDGIAEFEVAPTESDGRSKVYLFVETDTSQAFNATTNQEETVTKAVNTMIALPIFETTKDGDDSVVKDKIDIYPKNTLERISKVLIPLPKESFMYLDDGLEGSSISSGGTSTDLVVTRSVGDIVAFEIRFPVPVDFANTVVNSSGKTEYLYHHLNLRDLPDRGLSFYEIDDFELGGKSIYTYERDKDDGLVGGLSFHADYNRPDTNQHELERIKATRADFMIYTPKEITDENTAKLKALAGQTITLTLFTVVNEEAPLETHMNNIVGYNKVRNYDVNSPQNYKNKDHFTNDFQPFKKDFAKNIKNLNGLRKLLNTYKGVDFSEVSWQS